jgi:hypothetical protein
VIAAIYVIDSAFSRSVLVPDAQIKSDPGCNTPKYGMILSCIYQELLKTCPEIRPQSECKEIKDFIDKCPKQARRRQPVQKKSNFTASDKLGDAIRELLQDSRPAGLRR